MDIDFETTIEDGLDHLQDLGHRRFGLVLENLEGTPMAGYAPHLRVEDTFRRSVAERGGAGTIVYAGPGARAAATLHGACSRPTPTSPRCS